MCFLIANGFILNRVHSTASFLSERLCLNSLIWSWGILDGLPVFLKWQRVPGYSCMFSGLFICLLIFFFLNKKGCLKQKSRHKSQALLLCQPKILCFLKRQLSEDTAVVPEQECRALLKIHFLSCSSSFSTTKKKKKAALHSNDINTSTGVLSLYGHACF